MTRVSNVWLLAFLAAADTAHAGGLEGVVWSGSVTSGSDVLEAEITAVEHATYRVLFKFSERPQVEFMLVQDGYKDGYRVYRAESVGEVHAGLAIQRTCNFGRMEAWCSKLSLHAHGVEFPIDEFRLPRSEPDAG